MEDNLLYSEFTDLNVIHVLLKKTFTVPSRLEFAQKTGNHSLAKLTHKIKHHRQFLFYAFLAVSHY